MTKPQNVFISAISSDIGTELALLYHAQGNHVVGTYRNPQNIQKIKGIQGIDLIPCDLSDKLSVHRIVNKYVKLQKPWDVFISAAGQLEPIGPFFDSNFDDWHSSVLLNSTEQLRLLHILHPHRRRGILSKVIFFVGGGINNAFTNYSAYCLGKILLIKMCELLDDEYEDMHAIAIGTGWVNTKIHQQTMNARVKSGANYRRTVEFLKSGKQGTSCVDIFNCINWCFTNDKELTSGRNFSVVHDAWGCDSERLLFDLSQDFNKFKLRRHGG